MHPDSKCWLEYLFWPCGTGKKEAGSVHWASYSVAYKSKSHMALTISSDLVLLLVLAVVLATKWFPQFSSVLVLQEELRKQTGESKGGEKPRRNGSGSWARNSEKGWVLVHVARCSFVTLLATLNHCEEAYAKYSSVIVGHLLSKKSKVAEWLKEYGTFLVQLFLYWIHRRPCKELLRQLKDICYG